MKTPTQQQIDRAREWAERSIAVLSAMSIPDRHMWAATKPHGDTVFNAKRLRFVRHHLPDIARAFDELGLRL